MIASFGEPPQKLLYEFGKRVADFALASLTTVACAPALLAIAAAIRLDSPGPDSSGRVRVGRYGKSFSMYKFRTMHTDAHAYAFSPKQSQDPRIHTSAGSLRRTSLDELPQLFNVLQGKMSLVGPASGDALYRRAVQRASPPTAKRKTRITCLWQLSADRAFLTTKTSEDHLYYIRNRSLFMDMAILLHTLFFAMRGV